MGAAPAFRLGVPLILLAAGVLFATSARTAQGTNLRAGPQVRLAELIESRERRVAAGEQRRRALAAQVAAATRTAAAGDERVIAERLRAAQLEEPAGLRPVRGPGLRVSLDDAPRPSSGNRLPEGATPDDLVVHQQDVQAAVNGLWAGGATAMTLMGERVVATSAVRCVGNTLLLHGRVYSPPFVISAVGEPGALRAGLEAQPGVQIFRQYVDYYGLGFEVAEPDVVSVPAYGGSVDLLHATPLPS